ncbi:hypothetical protein [Plastoroseomonas hellenica]|uniref:hypothetical protein n=1 Tax=Plastoroseomonas hellenica TaxID=2687306 RepID=UPI001BABB464|nr:hypothetical protein [Plastoroseomonas hellenica]MBR0644961.1 hypothetical protein [Plastoroseomonas hellenica]
MHVTSIAIMGSFLLAACSTSSRVATHDLSTTIPDLLRAQVLNNIVRFRSDPHAIPAQYELGTGTSQTSSDTNVSTDLRFREIALTVVGLASSNSVSAQWTINPIVGISDMRRLQLLYRYAVHGGAYQGLYEDWLDVGVIGEGDPKHLPPSETLAGIVEQSAGPLPATGPIIRFGDLCEGNDTREVFGATIICFVGANNAYPAITRHPGRAPRRAPLPQLTAQEVRSRFIMWVAGASQGTNGTGEAQEPASSAGRPTTGTSSRSGSRELRLEPRSRPGPSMLLQTPR